MFSTSISKRQFRFQFPKTFFGNDILERYGKFLAVRNYSICDPFEWINESVQGLTFPGIKQPQTQQERTWYNQDVDNTKNSHLLPSSAVEYRSSTNVLTHMDKELKITMRHSESFLTWFMMYETYFYQYQLPQENIEKWYIDLLNDTNAIIGKLYIDFPIFSEIDPLEFAYNSTNEELTFDVGIKFSNFSYVNVFDDDWNKLQE